MISHNFPFCRSTQRETELIRSMKIIKQISVSISCEPSIFQSSVLNKSHSMSELSDIRHVNTSSKVAVSPQFSAACLACSRNSYPFILAPGNSALWERSHAASAPLESEDLGASVGARVTTGKPRYIKYVPIKSGMASDSSGFGRHCAIKINQAQTRRCDYVTKSDGAWQMISTYYV